MADHVAIRRLATAIRLMKTCPPANQHFQTRDLSGFGCDDLSLAIAADGLSLDYVKECAQRLPPHPYVMNGKATQSFDAATRRNLEIDLNLHGGKTTRYSPFDQPDRWPWARTLSAGYTDP